MTYFFFFKQKTAYEMRISDWSSDVCSSDLDLGFGVRYETPVLRPRVVENGGDRANVFAIARLVERTNAQIFRLLADHAFQPFRRCFLKIMQIREHIIGAAIAEKGRASWRERVCQCG